MTLLLSSAVALGLHLSLLGTFGIEGSPQGVEPSLEGTFRVYSNVPVINVYAEDGIESDLAEKKCNAELERSRQLLIRKGVSVILEVLPCQKLELSPGYSKVRGQIYFFGH